MSQVNPNRVRTLGAVGRFLSGDRKVVDRAL
jgi:hypothetical protein